MVFPIFLSYVCCQKVAFLVSILTMIMVGWYYKTLLVATVAGVV